MSADLSSHRLDELEIIFEDGDRSSRYPKANEFLSDGHHPFINTKNISDNHFDWTEVNFISDDKFNEIKKGRIEVNDIVIATRGSKLGKVAFYDKDNWEQPLINAQLLIIRCKDDRLYPKFLWYLLTSDGGQAQIESLKSGSAQPQLPVRDLKKFDVEYPSYDEQVQIVKTLDALNNKRLLNRQTNQTLEQIAQAIFKSWFVDFDPVKAKIQARQNGQNPERAAMCAISGKSLEELDQLSPETQQQLKTTAALFPDALVESELGEIPEGWCVSCVDDVCDFQNGYAFKSKEMSKSPENAYKVFKMGSIKKGGGLDKSKTKDYYEISKCEKLGRYLIKKGDLLMCMTDMKNNVALLGHTALMDVDNEYILNQRVGLLRTRNKKQANYPFLYILTNSEAFIGDLRSRANSGVQVNLSTSEIKDTKFILPSENVQLEFDKLTVQLQEKIFSLEAEQDYLSEIRDALLPKLLSGELSINSTQIELEVAI